MGGGHSPVTPSYGLAADCMTELYLVIANGSVIRVSNDTNDENITNLFWAIRGGGGSTFGVTVNITFALHDPPNNNNNNRSDNANNEVFTLYDGIFEMFSETAFKNIMNGIFNYTIHNMDSKVGGYILLAYEQYYPTLIVSWLFPYGLNYTQNSINNHLLNC